MAKDTRNLPAFLSNDADFRAWGSGIAAQIAAMGLVQTSDTGQINWTTVARPAAINTSAGYEVWRFADALQATKPVFIRLDYGVGGAVDRPRIIVRVGTATDGAGTLTGQVGTSVTLFSSGSKTAGTLHASFCSGSTSRLSLLTNVDISTSNYSLMFCVERSKTSGGVDTGDGIITFIYSVAGVQQFQSIPFSGTIPTALIPNPAISLSPTTGAISSVGPNVALSPTVAALGKPCFASWAAYISADIPKLAPISVDHLGAVRTMLPLGDVLLVGTGQFVQGTITGHSLAILWE